MARTILHSQPDAIDSWFTDLHGRHQRPSHLQTPQDLTPRPASVAAAGDTSNSANATVTISPNLLRGRKNVVTLPHSKPPGRD